jgi:hypothetical protein
MEREGGHVQGEEGEGQGVMSGPRRLVCMEAGLEASMAHARQDAAASGWSLGPDMTCLTSLGSVCSESSATRAPHVSCSFL